MPRAQRLEHRQPVVLCQHRAEAPGRGAEHRNRAIAEDHGNIPGRPREPVDSVLEDPGDAIVVFRRGQNQAIARHDLFAQRHHGGRQALTRLQIRIVKRNAMQGGDIKPDLRARLSLRRPQQCGVVRLCPQAAGNSQDLDHLSHLFS
ncbi:hypothetical protein D3C72_1144650 [compost metagenome]